MGCVRVCYKLRYFFLPNKFTHLSSLTEAALPKRCWYRKPISPAERLAITLWYLATGDSQLSQSFNFVVAPRTIGRILRETCEAITEALKPYMKPPTSEEDWNRIANGFHEL